MELVFYNLDKLHRKYPTHLVIKILLLWLNNIMVLYGELLYTHPKALPRISECLWRTPYEGKIHLATMEGSYLFKEEHFISF